MFSLNTQLKQWFTYHPRFVTPNSYNSYHLLTTILMQHNSLNKTTNQLNIQIIIFTFIFISLSKYCLTLVEFFRFK